jgi:hypothetical protein
MRPHQQRPTGISLDWSSRIRVIALLASGSSLLMLEMSCIFSVIHLYWIARRWEGALKAVR